MSDCSSGPPHAFARSPRDVMGSTAFADTRRGRAELLWGRIAQSICERRSIILCYHGVGWSRVDDDPGFLRVRPPRFRAQVELLVAAGFRFLTVAELAKRVQKRECPAGFAALSFDDGMEDNYSVVLPILRRYGIPATVYVTTGLIGRPNPWMSPTSGARMMTEDELRALARAGFELGAHSVNHPDLTQLDRTSCLRQMLESRKTLERLTGRAVETFAYPFCSYDNMTIEAARATGFRAAVTCQGRGSWAHYEMRRTMITGKDGLASYILKLAELYDPLMQSPPGRLVRAGTRGIRRRARVVRDARSAVLCGSPIEDPGR